MRLLLDTHVLIWIMQNSPRLSQRVADAVRSVETEVFVSVASGWEIGTKRRLGKLDFDDSFLDEFDSSLRRYAFEPLAINSQHAVRGARLPGEHRDPFDRLLVGQALCEGLTIATADRALATLGAPVIW